MENPSTPIRKRWIVSVILLIIGAVFGDNTLSTIDRLRQEVQILQEQRAELLSSKDE